MERDEPIAQHSDVSTALDKARTYHLGVAARRTIRMLPKSVSHPVVSVEGISCSVRRDIKHLKGIEDVTEICTGGRQKRETADAYQ